MVTAGALDATSEDAVEGGAVGAKGGNDAEESFASILEKLVALKGKLEAEERARQAEVRARQEESAALRLELEEMRQLKAKEEAARLEAEERAQQLEERARQDEAEREAASERACHAAEALWARTSASHCWHAARLPQSADGTMMRRRLARA